MPVDELRDAVHGLMGRAKDDLSELVAFQSVADPKQYPPEECAKAAQWVVHAFTEVGLQDVKASPTADGSLAVHGHAPGPEGTPTALLYCHYDVQPPLGEEKWTSPIWELTERDGRWYGRGSADCKGNIVMHLTALRALRQTNGGSFPCGVKLICEGSEEQGTGGLEEFVPPNADLLRADVILVCDTGNAAVGVPAATVSLRGMVNVVVSVEALASEIHSGMFGGAAPDALAAIVAMLGSLRDRDGNTTVTGLDNTETWAGEPYPPEQFRSDAGVVQGASLLGSGTVSDMLWARPSLTILGIDCPPVVGSAAAIAPHARARLNLRIPPGTTPSEAEKALREHLIAAAPWGVQVTVETEATGSPFRAETGGPGYGAMAAAMEEAYGRPMATLGQGGSIPLCNVFSETYPDAELFLMGVEEPLALIHAPNESVDPTEIANMALVEALFLQRYAAARG